MAKTESKQPSFLKHEIKMNRAQTIASAFGNYLGILAIFTLLVLLLSGFVWKKSFLNKK